MKVTQSAFIEDIKNRFSFYPPITDEQREDHELVNSIFVDAAVKVAQICPQSPELETAINSLAVARAMANASLAIYVNSRNQLEDLEDLEDDAELLPKVTKTDTSQYETKQGV